MTFININVTKQRQSPQKKKSGGKKETPNLLARHCDNWFKELLIVKHVLKLL